MNTNTAIKLLAVVILLGLGLFFLMEKGGSATEKLERGGVADPAASARLAELEPVAEEETTETAGGERIEAAAVLAGAAANSPWRGELAGLIGRVVEADGTPVVGIRVALLEFDTDMLFSSGFPDPNVPPPSIQREETITDDEGRFVLGGARAPSFHGLGVDLGGPRATLRVLDSALAHKKRTDIGDVVLAPYGILTGRVVDEGGAAIAGARIRVGPFPEEIFLGAPYELRSESLVGISMLVAAGDGQGVVELPGWVRRFVDELPVPTTYTDDAGYFRLEGVPLAKLVGGVDKPGYAGAPLGPVDMTGVAEQDVGNLVLSRGRTITGVVEDSEGEPVVGVDVYAGAEVPAGFVAILQPCGQTDEEGQFSLTGVPGEGQVMAITRRTKSEPWIGEVTLRHDDMLLSLEAAIQLTVLVQNEEGEPLPNAQILLEPAFDPGGGMMGIGEITRFLPRDAVLDGGFKEVEPGRYVNTSVTPGKYDVTVQVAGLARGWVNTEIWDEESEVVVTCPTGTHVTLTVVDAATQEPIHRAGASILVASQMTGFVRLASGLTNASGQARLGPIDPPREERKDEETMLVVRHPRYADHSIVLEPGTSEVYAALEGGGILAGNVHWGGEIPTRPYMLILEYRGADGFLEMFHLPQFGLTDLTGAFRLANLPAGQYRVELFERFLDQDPLGLMTEQLQPARLFQETVEIVSGETTELVIDLTPTGRGPTARIKGRVRVDGREIEGAEVTVRGNGSVRTETDQWGRFETEDFSVWGDVRVSIEGDVRLPSGETSRMEIYQESFELQAGELRDIDVDLVPLALRVEVVEAATGQPVSGARVTADSMAGGKTAQGFQEGFATDDRGEVSVWVPAPGDYMLAAEATDYAESRSRATAPESGEADVTRITLARSVPCAGRVAVPNPPETAMSFSYLAVRSEDNVHQNGMMLSGPDYEFDIDGLAPGTYRTWIYIEGREGQEMTFELGPDGDRNLILDYVPQEE